MSFFGAIIANVLILPAEPQPVNNKYGLTTELSSDDEQNE